nr:reverse transcriptase domain-containing protein [Tanacetum cinerariifolium]
MPTCPDYSPTSDTESDPSEDPSLDHIPPLLAIPPFLSSADDTTDSDTLDTPPLPTLDDSARDSSSDLSSKASSDFHSDASSDSSSRHSFLDHSFTHLPSTSAGPSRKRRRSSDGKDIDPEIQAEIDECIAYADALRDRGIDARVVVEAVDREESETGTRGRVKVRVERVTHSVIKGVYREQGGRIVRVESAITALTERVTELERDNRRLRGITSVETQRVDRLYRGMSRISSVMLVCCKKMPNTQSGASMTHKEVKELVTRCVAKEMKDREAAMNLEPLNENGDEQEGGNGGNEKNENEVKDATCTLQDSALTWWKSHKRTIGVEPAYDIKWDGLMKLMTKMYYLRNEIQKMETEFWNLTMKRNDVTAYTKSVLPMLLRNFNSTWSGVAIFLHEPMTECGQRATLNMVERIFYFNIKCNTVTKPLAGITFRDSVGDMDTHTYVYRWDIDPFEIVFKCGFDARLELIYHYEIYAPGGVFVPKALGERYLYPGQAEVAFLSAIAP